MNIPQFITAKGIRPADAIILNKKFFGMVDHFAIYIGIMNYNHCFVANYVDGVKVIPNSEIDRLLEDYVPTGIEKFPGKEVDRPAALKRAMSRIGQKAYNYLTNNCEHFKNFVHTGIEQSSQVQKAGVATALGGLGILLMGAGKKNENWAMAGFLIILIGIIITILGSPESPNKDKH